MTIDRRTALGVLAGTPFLLGTIGEAPVTVFEAGSFITMEPSCPRTRFVAVANGMILGLADQLADLAPWTRGREVTVDRRFAGKTVLPGLIDPHVHPMQAAIMLNVPFLAPDDWSLPTGNYRGTRTAEGYRLGLAHMLAGSDARPFITWGYHELFHGGIDRQDLDRLAPDRPVVIWQRSFHDIFVNTVILGEWGLGTRSAFDAAIAGAGAEAAHADFDRGWFSETALPLALTKLRPAIMTPDRLIHGMGALKQMMLSRGVTTISDMGTGIFAGFEMEAQLIRSAFEQPGNPSRVMLMPMAAELQSIDDIDDWLAGVSERFSSTHVRVDRRVKMLADGAFFAQNMRMNAPGYSDGHLGKWITQPDVLRAQFERFWNAGFCMHIHVNGDEGLDVVLEGIERLPVRRSQTITLEHLGYSTEAQNRRIARMGLMVSAQPNYIRVLGDAYAEQGLGPDRASAMNRLGSLERKGIPLGLHSDFNMAPIDPLYLAWIAANRETIGRNVRAPEERLSLDKALRAITIEAAQVIGMDSLVGSIAAGKRADFAVLDRDPYSAGARRLNEIKVEAVVFEGVVASV